MSISHYQSLSRVPIRHLYCGILAAGSSQRFGSPKQLAEVHNTTLLEHCLQQLVRATSLMKTRGEVEHVSIGLVLGAYAEEIVASLRLDVARFGVDILFNPVWSDGMASSIALAATEAERRGAEALLLCSGDQVALTSDNYVELVGRAVNSAGAEIVCAHYSDTKGIPALFRSRLFSELQTLHGHKGAKSIIDRSEPHVVAVECEAASIDIDSPEDLYGFLVPKADSTTNGSMDEGTVL